MKEQKTQSEQPGDAPTGDSGPERRRLDGLAGARAILDALAYAAAVISRQGEVELANARAMELGFEAGRRVEQLSEPWAMSLVEEALRRRGQRVGLAEIQGNAESADREAGVLVRTQGDQERLYVPEAAALLEDGGDPARVMVSIMDVTAASRARAARAKLLSAVSHDLKTPLTSIQMSVHLLLEDAASRLTPRQLELLVAAREDTDRLHQMLERMLRESRQYW